MDKRPQEPKKVPFYKKAVLPWALIVGVTLLFTGFILGWHSNQAHEQSIVQSFKNGVASVPKESK